MEQTAFADERKGLLVSLRGQVSSLKSAERKVASFVLKSPEKIRDLTVAEASAQSEVSEATVIRFCRTIGLKGYQDLKYRLAEELASPVETPLGEDIMDGDSTEEVLKKVFLFNMQTLDETLQVLDPKGVERAVGILERADKILVVGVGTSSANVLDAHNKFFRLGLRSVAQSDAHLQMMEAALLTPRDAVLAITHSGKTRDPVETLAVAQRAGAKTISITSNPRSPITKRSDTVLLTSSRETAFRDEALASRLAQTSIVDALYTLIYIRNRKRAVTAEKKISAVIGQKQI
ncbi:MAG: MurR/RpiR family transcriptional regulator [Nitrospinae bacterium]|nr:MurR/RpiR family transcriptional regulator [Nitrospinota bacterium]